MRLFILSLLCALSFGMAGNIAEAGQAVHPLAPPDTSSPRATLKTFLDETNRAVQAFKRGQRAEARRLGERAARCFNLEKEPPSLRYVIGFYGVLYLKETLDRIEIPPYEEIPDAQAVRTEKLTSWTVPYTEITITAVKDSSSVEQFLFTGETVRRSKEFYSRVKNLPYRPDSGGGALLDEVSASSGLVFLNNFVNLLPLWAKAEIAGQAVWQWTGLALYFLLGLSAVLLIYGYGGKALGFLDKRLAWNLTHYVGGLLVPLALIVFAEIGLWFIVYGLHILNTDVYLPAAYVLLVIFYLGIVWLIGAFLNRVAAAVIAVGGFVQGTIDTQLIRFCFQVLTFIIICGTIVRLGARLGLPTYSLVTGLGIGGIAVALAGREALSNLIGTIIILLDQPFKLGDFIVVGEGDRGTVTEIGLRSTRIRTRDGILVSIPNSNVANMKIVNESAPVSEARIHVPVGVAYGSSAQEVEQALLAACQKCEYVVFDRAPSVRLVRFGDSSLEYELLVWIVQPEFRARATNQLNRAIDEEFRKRGIEIPFPQRDLHIRADK
ncbi:MAG: mechanosensitive ion channel family protein [Thermodesulfobacteriota bacterium]